MKSIAILVADWTLGSSLALTLDMLNIANLYALRLGRTPLKWGVFGLSPTTQLTNGLSVVTETVTKESDLDFDALVVPGMGLDHPSVLPIANPLEWRYEESTLNNRTALPDVQTLARVVQRHHERGGIVCGSCSGVLILGEAGVLGGKTITTNPRLITFVETKYKTKSIDIKRMIVEDGSVITGGAALAQMDLMLKLISRSLGLEVANQTMSMLLIESRISQSRYMAWNHLGSSDDLVRKFENLVEENFSKSLSISQIAKLLNVTEKTLARRVQSVTGHSPKALVQTIKVRHVQNLLDTSKLSLDEIAMEVGYSNSNALRKLTEKYVKLSPGAMRQNDLH
jgi:transcriptional regulator GlxA family with amidase domain